MNYESNTWSDVQKTWLQEYQWLIDAKYPGEILTFMAFYEYLLAYSKALYGSRLSAGSDYKPLKRGFERLIKTKPITLDLNKNIFDLCYKLIQTCPQPFSDDSDFIYYEEIKKRVKKDYPDSFSSFPPHEHNHLNNPPLGEKVEQRNDYTNALADLFGWSWSLSQKTENTTNKEKYFGAYFYVLVHSRNWLYHNNKAGNVEVDKFVLKKHLKIMNLMIENWK